MLFFFSKMIFASILEIEEHPKEYSSIHYTYLIKIFSSGCFHPIKKIFSATSKFIAEPLVKENVPEIQDFHITKINLIFSSTKAKEIYLPFYEKYILSQLKEPIPEPTIIIGNKIDVFQSMKILEKDNHLNVFTPYNFNNDSRIIDDFFLILTIVSNFSKQKDSEIVKNISLYNSTYVENLKLIEEKLLQYELLLNDFLTYFFNEMNLKKNILSPENLKPSYFSFIQTKETKSFSLLLKFLQDDLSRHYETADYNTQKKILTEIFFIYQSLIEEIHRQFSNM